jgi:hypothetical protein
METLPNLKILFPYFIFIGALTAYLAHTKRGRRAFPWFFIGFFFGLLGILALFCLPKKQPLQPILLKGPIITPLSSYESISLEHPSLPMTQEMWYFLNASHEQQGPMSFEGLKKSYEEGKVFPSSYVWNSQLENWEKLEALSEYLSLIEKRPQS